LGKAVVLYGVIMVMDTKGKKVRFDESTTFLTMELCKECFLTFILTLM
jgi:hypothetical protein